MRELKFRAWNNDLGRYFYAPSESWSIAFHSESTMVQMWCSDGLVDEIPVDAIEQFTGLTDKNGVEIYEGDILKSYAGNREVRIGEYSVSEQCGNSSSSELRVGCFSFGHKYQSSEPIGTAWGEWKLEVVGNIHQNQELLE